MLKGTLEFSLTEDSCFLKLIGVITWEVSADLDTFLTCVLNEVVLKKVYFDLSATSYMDSTSLGVLAHFKRLSSQYTVSFTILNPNDEILKNLQDVGLTRIFQIEHGTKEYPSSGNAVPSSKAYTPKEIGALVKKTHLALVTLDEKNRELFDAIIKSIDDEDKAGSDSVT